MGKWTSSTGNTVTILPWTDKGFKFTLLDCEECLGGKIAKGWIEMTHDGNEEALKMITDENIVDIELGTEKEGTQLRIHGIITHREYYKNLFNIEFHVMVDKDLYTRRSQLIFDDIDGAIKSLWRWKIDNRTKTDLPSGIKYNQGGDYDIEYLQTLCGSYRKDTVYAFGLDNLLIKDIIGIDSTGHKEPYWTLTGGEQVIQEKGPKSDKYRLNYDYKLYKEPEDPWEEIEDSSVNLDLLMHDDRYRLIHKDHNVLRKNYYWNQKFYNSKMYNQINLLHTTFFQTYRVGDVVYYERPCEEDEVPFKVYIISKIRYYYQTEPTPGQTGPGYFPFRLEYTLHCLEEFGVRLNTSDPMERS